jgi:hypothetical protein
MYKGARARAKAKDLPFDLTVDYVLGLIGGGICPVFGTPFNISGVIQSSTSASLHRIRPELGYTKGNCAVISQLANQTINSATIDQLHRVCEWVQESLTGGLNVL